MTDTQSGKYAMYNVFITFLDALITFFGVNKQLTPAIAALKSAVDNIKTILPKEAKTATDTTPITENKATAFEIMVDTAVGFSKAALEWAKSSPDTRNLIKSFKLTTSTFKTAEPKSIAQARALLKLFQDNSVALIAATEITDLQISGFETMINNAEADIGLPGMAKGQSKVVTSSIDKAFVAADAAVLTVKNILLSKYGKNMPVQNDDLISNMNQATKTIIVKRYTALKIYFNVIISGLIIEGAKADIPDLKKSAVSNINGIGTIPSIRPKQAHAIFSHPDFKTVYMDIKPIKGRTLELHIIMTPNTSV